jgi:hypothetical protein
MKITKVTPLHIVDRIEPCLPLWQALGFEKTVEVPHGDRLGFVILVGNGTEVMLQTKASVADDLPPLAKLGVKELLFCEVDSLAAARKAVTAVEGTNVFVEERTTPYKMREMWLTDASGHVFGLAEHV